MKNLNNKTVFITGGLSGIGKACAKAAISAGANVSIADLDSDQRNNIMEEISRDRSKVLFTGCDVADFLQVKNAIEKTVSVFSSLDVGLNNAGIGGKPEKVGEMDEATWLQVININLNGVFYCMRFELEQMAKQRRGVIVNMASILGKVGFSTSSHYAAAKHGVIGLTQTAALEYATEGIRVNAICPGFIETPLLTKGHINDHPDVKEHIINLHPMKRLGKPEEIANAFLFLATDDSSFVSGSTLEIDGGFLAE